MMENNFIELATYCVNRYKEAHNSREDHYVNTLFVAITEEGKVQTSTTPHILRNVSQCILIHQTSTLAITNYYSWYKVEHIDENGCVYDDSLAGGIKLYISACSSFSNQIMSLVDKSGFELLSCERPWEKHMASVWSLYTCIKDIKSVAERKLIADLYKKNQTILSQEEQIDNLKFINLLLEQERDQYKNLLEDIRKMIAKQ